MTKLLGRIVERRQAQPGVRNKVLSLESLGKTAT
jgi:hypothetical protein